METFFVYVAYVGLSACLGSLLWQLWGLICNERTFRDRNKIIENVRNGSDWHNFFEVNYDDHVRAYMLLRDPTKLYNKELNWKN